MLKVKYTDCLIHIGWEISQKSMGVVTARGDHTPIIFQCPVTLPRGHHGNYCSRQLSCAVKLIRCFGGESRLSKFWRNSQYFHSARKHNTSSCHEHSGWIGVETEGVQHSSGWGVRPAASSASCPPHRPLPGYDSVEASILGSGVGIRSCGDEWWQWRTECMPQCPVYATEHLYILKFYHDWWIKFHIYIYS